MFDEYGRRRPETFTATMRAQHEAMYHATPEATQKWQNGEADAASAWFHEVEDVRRLLPRRVKLRYALNRERLPARLRAAYTGPVSLDRSTLEFLAQAPHSRCWSWARTMLCWFVTDTTALGLLGAYQMHVLSTAQCRELLTTPGSPEARCPPPPPQPAPPFLLRLMRAAAPQLGGPGVR